MELYTVDRDFLKQETIDDFDSVIWTERYYGDGDFELEVSATDEMMELLPEGQLMMCEDSDEPQILEHREINGGILKTTGISLTKWFNNRTLRADRDHRVKEIFVDEWIWGSPVKAGRIMWWVVDEFLTYPYPETVNSIPTGVPAVDRNRLHIPGLVTGTVDLAGPDLELSIPFGPIYDILYSLAKPYEIGMNTKLDYSSEAGYQLSFNTYRGANRTSEQDVNPVIQFSPEMDSFTNITDLESIADHRNLVFLYGTNIDYNIISSPGRASSVDDSLVGFDLRVIQEFVDNLEIEGQTGAYVQNLVNQKAQGVLAERRAVQLVDGEIVQVEGVKFGENFFLGDVVEVVGNTGALQNARVTEYIRSQDSAGERAYPTLSMIDESVSEF